MRSWFRRGVLACAAVGGVAYGNAAAAAELYEEQYRPQFHFSAKQGWLNDPNGLVYFEGKYHLFYQHNPFGTGWGNMSWGHATSPDLIHWTEKSPAIVGDATGVKFSGTANIDYANTAGLQVGSTPTMLLHYTSVGSFDQRMAYSNDGGNSFRYYSGNPILPATPNKDDRDPQVFWHEGSNKWVQALWVAETNTRPSGIAFYGSADMKNWSYLSETPGYFECPDIFELAVDGNSNDKRWVLYGADGKYQVGQFNGTAFVPDAPSQGKLTQDYGANFYAAQTWHNVPASDGRRIQVAWMNGASYPDMPFNQQMSFPVELTLHNTPSGIRMYREPIAEIASLHDVEHTVSNTTLRPGTNPLAGLTGDQFHITTEIELGTSSTFGFNIRGTQVNYSVATQTLSVLGRTAPLAPINGRISLELLLDRSSLEVFGNNGAVSLTSGFLPSAANQQIGLFATGGNARVVSLSAFELKSAWPTQQPAAPQGLIGKWNFNEPSLAAGFVDKGGDDLLLSNSGVVSGGGGVAGNGANLDNANDYAFVPDNSLLNADSMSVSLWFRPDAAGQSVNIVNKARASAANSWGLEQLTDGRLKFLVSNANGGSTAIVTQQAVAIGDWHHAVASYDAELGRLELFVDGKLAAAGEGAVNGPIAYDNSPMFLGKQMVGTGSGVNAFDGTIDEMQLYGSALTPGEIRFVKLHPDLAATPDVYAPGPLTLQINSDTGAASIVNPTGTALSIKGYSIHSNVDGLNVVGWQSLDDRVGGEYVNWQEANPTPSTISEINPVGSLAIGASGSLALGAPASAMGTPKFGTAVRNTQYAFEYLTATGQVQHGLVELMGSNATNNLVITVDPVSGQATLKNDSTYAVGLLGYSITSQSGSLRPANGAWTSLADQGFAQLQEANPSATSLSELVPFAGNALVIAPGQTFTLGSLFNVAGDDDLQFQFYLSSNPLEGDFNADGSVNTLDLQAWKAGFGTAYSGEQFVKWQRNYGKTSPQAAPVILRGVVRYGTVGVLAQNVPEPTACFAAALAFPFAAAVGRKRRTAMIGMGAN
jgi:fructan beta-fructosidase